MNDTIQRAPAVQRKPRTTKKSAYYDPSAAEPPSPDNIHSAGRESFGISRNLPMPEPMPGFSDRWVRIGVDGKTDSKNIRNKMSKRGFRPRDPKTAPNMPVSMMGDSEVIGDEDNVLMTRPTWMQEQEQKEMREAAKNQMREVHRNIHKTKATGGGFGGIHYDEDKSSARSGRPAPVDDDPAFA